MALGVAARAAFGLVASLVPLVVTAALPLVVDRFDRAIERSAASSDVPPQFAAAMDLLLELAALLRPFAQAVAASGAAIGVALFVAALMLLRRSDTGRRAARVLLVADALHSITAAAWLVVLVRSTLGAWNERYQATIGEVLDALPNHGARLPIDVRFQAWTHPAPWAAWCAAGVAACAALFWLAGRPAVRDWCSAGDRQSPIAPHGAPR